MNLVWWRDFFTVNMHWYITALTDYILLFHSFFHTCRYLNAIQTTCPHILRYLTTAVITNKRRRTVLKDLVKVIQQESYTYKDPITEFLECLYVNFDFDGAQQKLRECETVSFFGYICCFVFHLLGFLCTLFQLLNTVVSHTCSSLTVGDFLITLCHITCDREL